ncbi:MAG TPA: hypothetical protein PLS84_11545 [Salinivirgaceae bacterium]|nr:hypothetical protein [Salinivirgaceae bacterium]
MIPKILVQIDQEQEVNLFLKFLNHPEFPNHRTNILQVFPALNELIADLENEDTAVRHFLDKFYIDYKSEVELAIQDSKEELAQSSRVLDALGQAMDYSWPNNVNYVAVPTILPFSPFQHDTFFFSITGQVMSKSKTSALAVAIHEISHFIFFEYLKKINDVNNISLPRDAKYYLKESLTAALFNEDPLRKELKIEIYLGNPEVRDIFIKAGPNHAEVLVDYIRRKYIENRQNNKNFEQFLTDLVVKFNDVSEEFSKKRKIWNLWGKELQKNKEEFLKYKKPIEIM